MLKRPESPIFPFARLPCSLDSGKTPNTQERDLNSELRTKSREERCREHALVCWHRLRQKHQFLQQELPSISCDLLWQKCNVPESEVAWLWKLGILGSTTSSQTFQPLIVTSYLAVYPVLLILARVVSVVWRWIHQYELHDSMVSLWGIRHSHAQLPRGLVPGPGHFSVVSMSPWAAPLRHQATQQTDVQPLATPDWWITPRKNESSHPEARPAFATLIAFFAFPIYWLWTFSLIDPMSQFMDISRNSSLALLLGPCSKVLSCFYQLHQM